MNKKNHVILNFDTVVVGAGASGLFAAGRVAQQGLRVLLIEHGEKVAEKVRISGGGRCNFTNRDFDLKHASHHFVSENSHFCRSALSRYTPRDFMDLLVDYGVAYHEKHRGQMFCDKSSKDLIQVLLQEAKGCTLMCQTKVESVRLQRDDTEQVCYDVNLVTTDAETGKTRRISVQTPALIVATGGLSIPKMGATDWGYRLAKQFAVPIVPTSPGLVPFVWAEEDKQSFTGLAGLALPVAIATGQGAARMRFEEDLLFTHLGLSGPAALQISNYWQPGQPVEIDLLAQIPDAVRQLERNGRKTVGNTLAQILPKRFAERWIEIHHESHPEWSRSMAEISNKSYDALLRSLREWSVVPQTTEGYKKAEVTRAGVDTRALSSQTMECLAQPGLYFIGEVVDVTGWLGGYNFQWAWASAAACAQAICEKHQNKEMSECG